MKLKIMFISIIVLVLLTEQAFSASKGNNGKSNNGKANNANTNNL